MFCNNLGLQMQLFFSTLDRHFVKSKFYLRFPAQRASDAEVCLCLDVIVKQRYVGQI